MPPSFKCPLCNALVATLSGAKSHVRQVHPTADLKALFLSQTEPAPAILPAAAAQANAATESDLASAESNEEERHVDGENLLWDMDARMDGPIMDNRDDRCDCEYDGHTDDGHDHGHVGDEHERGDDGHARENVNRPFPKEGTTHLLVSEER